MASGADTFPSLSIEKMDPLWRQDQSQSVGVHRERRGESGGESAESNTRSVAMSEAARSQRLINGTLRRPGEGLNAYPQYSSS